MTPDRTAALAPLRIRRDREIYAADGGWFRARWHFSFDHYYDPEHMGVGTLRVFNHDTLIPGAVWPMHPHRDVEGITWVVAGEFEHADSLGNDGVLLPGGVQRMTLGSGAWHSERNHSKTQPVEFIQMWILPAIRSLPPSVEQKQFTVEDRTNRLLEILRPFTSEGTGIAVHQQVWMYASRLEPGHAVAHAFAEARGGYLYIIEGDAELNGEPLSKGDAAKILGAGHIELRATQTTELLLVDTPL
ncbi:MAG TPA: pirin family protein [Dehalococcoidia bacterium]|nr:pirin family protein [Dehalococcoidia bacterium]